MDTLFTAMENERKQQVAPLAVRMRPRTLEDVVGQQDAVGPGSWLRAAIEQDNVSSVILYGPGICPSVWRCCPRMPRRNSSAA